MQSYVKMFFSFLDETDAMTDAEVGRLVRQIVEYGRTGNTEKYLKGNEKYVFPLYKTQIDRDSERYAAVSQKRKEAGKAGAQANASKCQQMLANASKCQQTLANASKCYQDKEEDKDKEEDVIVNNNSSPDFETVEAYASSNLDYLSPGNMEELISFRDDLPDDVIKYAIDCACANGVRRWSYVSRILQTWLNDGILTLGAAKARNDSRNKTSTAKKPEKPDDDEEVRWLG